MALLHDISSQQYTCTRSYPARGPVVTARMVVLALARSSLLLSGHHAITPRSPPCSALTPVAAYATLLQAYPVPTKALTQGLIWSAGDVVAQLREESGSSVSVERTAKFFVTGVGSGVLWSQYYDAADALIAPAPGGVVVHTALSLALEQFLWCPVVFATYQIPIAVLQNGGALSEVPGAVRRQLGDMLVANLKIWTPANIVIYNVPLQWRVLCSNGVDLVWGYVCASFAADACAPDDDECLADAATELGAPALGSRRPALLFRRAGLPRLVRSRASAWWRERTVSEVVVGARDE